MKTKLKCIVKDCQNKVIINLQTIDLEDSVVQFFNMCFFHKKQFKNKVKAIKNEFKN